jgi:hypothetical protein
MTVSSLFSGCNKPAATYTTPRDTATTSTTATMSTTATSTKKK